MSSYVCNAYQLLPGEPCPEYAYRYRFLGKCLLDPLKEEQLATAFCMLVAKCRSVSTDEKESELLTRWLSSVRERWTTDRFTGWDPRTGLAFRFEGALENPAVGMVWQWRLEKPARRNTARRNTVAKWNK